MTTWTEQGELFTESQGSFAPEELATEVFSRQFVKDNGDGTFTVITEEAAGVWIEGEFPEGRPCDVKTCTEILTCTDPDDAGGTEISSEYVWEFVNYVALSVEEATKEARRNIEFLNAEDYN